MSVTTTSGRSASTAASSDVEVAADGGDLEVRLRLEQAPDALAHEVVILGEHESDRHALEDTPVTSPVPQTARDVRRSS